MPASQIDRRADYVSMTRCGSRSTRFVAITCWNDENVPDFYTYAGTKVLRNRFGITDPAAAHDLETRVSYQRLHEVLTFPVPRHFDLDHLQALHRHLYQDVWEWAGELRLSEAADAAYAVPGLAACPAELIEGHAADIFGGLGRERFLRGLSRADFAGRLAWYWGEIVALHPFREGNPRASKVLFHQLAIQGGWRVRWELIDAHHLKHAGLLARFGQREALRDLWLESKTGTRVMDRESPAS